MSPRSTPSPTIAAWWLTASTPSTARATASGSRTSPSMQLGPRVEVVRAARGGRRRAACRATRTSCPASSSASTMCEPMNPAPPVTRITAARRLPSRPVPDVILPVLDERDAIPWVLERMPAGYTPIVVDNGSTDGSGELAASLGARVVVEPVPGFGAACFAGLSAAESDVVCFMDCDASFDPRELPRVADPVLGGRGRPDARRAPAGRARRVAAARAGRRTRCSRSSCAGARGRRCATSARCAPRAARRCSTSASATAASAGRWRWCCAPGGGLDDPRGRRLLPPARRALEGHRHRPRDRARDPRHDECLTVTPEHLSDPRAVGARYLSCGPALIVIAKAPVAGRVKTRLTPPCTPAQAAALAAGGAAGHAWTPRCAPGAPAGASSRSTARPAPGCRTASR